MIKYKGGYKYQTTELVTYQTNFRPSEIKSNRFVTLHTSGLLSIEAGYAFDGSSGGWDSKNVMRASLIHDALCQMVNEKLIPKDYQEGIDWILREVCLEDGMSKIRAWWIYRAVRRFDKSGLKKYKQKEILTAP